MIIILTLKINITFQKKKLNHQIDPHCFQPIWVVLFLNFTSFIVYNFFVNFVFFIIFYSSSFNFLHCFQFLQFGYGYLMNVLYNEYRGGRTYHTYMIKQIKGGTDIWYPLILSMYCRGDGQLILAPLLSIWGRTDGQTNRQTDKHT